jgi:hypothetical protein
MRSRALIIVLSVVTSMAAISGPAHAKGVQRATVTGPKLDAPLVFTMNDDLDGVEAFVQETGIYPSLFETSPNPIVQSQPTMVLGPRYDVAYVMRVPGRPASVVHQDLYPYAQPDPVTYTAPGQPTIDHSTSIGGWYVSGPTLLPLLISKGLPDRGPAAAPASTPASSDPGSSAPWLVLGLAAAAVAALVGGNVLVQRRRMPSPNA